MMHDTPKYTNISDDPCNPAQAVVPGYKGRHFIQQITILKSEINISI